MPKRLHLYLLVGLAGCISAGISWYQGGTLQLAILKNLPLVVLGLTVALIAFDRGIWRWGWLYPWFVAVPNLGGAWTGQLRIQHGGESEDEGASTETSDDIRVEIEQRYWLFTMKIDWVQGGVRTRFRDRTALSVQSGVCAWASHYDHLDNAGGVAQSRLAGMMFSVPPAFCENKPATVTIYYRTTDGQVGELCLKRA